MPSYVRKLNCHYFYIALGGQRTYCRENVYSSVGIGGSALSFPCTCVFALLVSL